MRKNTENGLGTETRDTEKHFLWHFFCPFFVPQRLCHGAPTLQRPTFNSGPKRNGSRDILEKASHCGYKLAAST